VTYRCRCWAAGGEGPVLETQLPVKHFLLGVLCCSPPSDGTAISCSVVYREAQKAFLFPVKLKLSVPYGVEMVKTVVPNI